MPGLEEWDDPRDGTDDIEFDVKVAESDDELGDDQGDERLEADQRAPEDESDAEGRRSRQEKRQRYRERRKNALKDVDQLRRQNAELLARLQQLESRTLDQDRAAVESQLQAAQAAFQRANKELKEAIETGDGDRHVKAMTERERAALQIRQLDGARRQTQQQPQRLPPEVESAARGWIDDNPWFDPDGKDVDSKVVLAIDDHLSKTRQDVGTPAYWKALDDEVRKRLPHRFDEDDDDDDRRGPPVSGRSDPTRPSSRRERIYLSPDRKRMLQDIGVWGDPEAMKPYLKEFRDFDRKMRNA